MSQNHKHEEEDTVERGDLGLGRGLKPGAIERPEDEYSEFTERDIALLRHAHSAMARSTSAHTLDNFDRKYTSFPIALDGNPKSKMRMPKLGLRWLRRSKSECPDLPPSSKFPEFAEVPLGTSFRQQRELYLQQMKELFPDLYVETNEETSEPTSPNDGSVSKKADKIDHRLLEQKLKKAETEVELLQQDLDLCQRQLEAKYKAIKIMQRQSHATQRQQVDVNNWVKQSNKKLIEDMNKLQFELDHQQTSMMFTQQTYAERLDGVCQENSALMATLEARAEETRKLHAEKMALAREKDELLALLDIQERQRYETSNAGLSGNEERYGEFTSAELAVLGACRCRIRSPDPCGCAHAAAYMKKVINRQREEIDLHKRRRDDALLIADAYRMAFEEQLAGNKRLMQKIAEFSSSPIKKTDKVKAALRWVISQLNDDDEHSRRRRAGLMKNHQSFDSENNNMSQSEASEVAQAGTGNNSMLNQSEGDASLVNGEDVSSINETSHTEDESLNESPQKANQSIERVRQMSDEELVSMLIEMINDKTEALVHQRLAARMLASRTQKLEQKLGEYGDDLEWETESLP